MSCNYVEGGEHCLYLDWASSGITVDGGVCHNNRNGLKLNTGHSNSVTSLIVSNPKGLAGWISCQNYDVNNCEQDPGSVWEDQRAQFYNSPEMRHVSNHKGLGTPIPVHKQLVLEEHPSIVVLI